MAGELKKHKVAKGETMIGIAKKYKHKDWKTVWDHKENAALKKKRKHPTKILRGDVVVIPETAADRKKREKEFAARVASLVAIEIQLKALRSHLAPLLTAQARLVGRLAAAHKAVKKGEENIKDLALVNRDLTTMLTSLDGTRKQAKGLEQAMPYILEMNRTAKALAKNARDLAIASMETQKRMAVLEGTNTTLVGVGGAIKALLVAIAAWQKAAKREKKELEKSKP